MHGRNIQINMIIVINGDDMNKMKIILATLINNPKSISRIIDIDEYYKNHIIKKYGFKMLLPAVDIENIVEDLESIVFPFTSFCIGSGAITISLLITLAAKKPNCRFLEIGTYLGYTTASVAKVAKECITIDIDDMYGKYCRNLPNVEFICKKSVDIDWSKMGLFDIIYIDGSHHYKDVVADTKSAFEHLKPNGIIIWDDFINSLGEYGKDNWIRWEIFAGILDGCPQDKINQIYLISNTPCAGYFGRNFKEINYSDVVVFVKVIFNEAN